ncbi:hypothetical protein HJC99_01485 [Candidatus Saccharibacteria bacterium]|nr:hypothetical protein [Candidatus Saccharibacteria bacterium]
MYSELVEEAQAAYPHIEAGEMFSMACLKLDDKVLGGDWHGDFVVKLSEDGAKKALEITGAVQFSPATGHVMKQWIVVPAAVSDRWFKLLEQAVEYRMSHEYK